MARIWTTYATVEASEIAFQVFENTIFWRYVYVYNRLTEEFEIKRVSLTTFS